MDELIDKLNTNIAFIKETGNEFFPGLCDDAGLEKGKRLRARMVFAFSGRSDDETVKIATAIELLHAATLIHDDILDNSDVRRGERALYKKHGLSRSLLFGDYLFSAAFSLAAGLDDSAVFRWMTDALREVFSGEITESFKKKNSSLSKQEYFSIIEKKSGVLFGLSCGLGARLRGVPKAAVADSYGFGVKAGIGYQIMDDYLDYFGEDESKEKFKDFREGVVTLPLIYLLERCSEREKAYIVTFFTDRRPADTDMPEIISLMKHYDVPEAIFGEIKGVTADAAKLFPPETEADVKKHFDIVNWLTAKMGMNDKSVILTEKTIKEVRVWKKVTL